MKKSLDDQERAGKAAVSANVLTEVKEIMEKQGGKPEILVAELQALSNTKVLYILIACCIHVAPSLMLQKLFLKRLFFNRHSTELSNKFAAFVLTPVPFSSVLILLQGK